MPLTGNRLGPRQYHAYTSDTGAVYRFRTDNDNGAAGGMEINAALQDRPVNLQPRYLNLQLIDGAKTYRKRLVCGDATTAPYVNNLGTTIAIDGATWTVTGKVGERRRG